MVLKCLFFLTIVLTKPDSANLINQSKGDSISSISSFKSDTLFLTDIDTATLSINEKSKVILINSRNSTDYFKYVFPLLTLLLGIGINKFLEHYSKQKKLRSILKRWIAEIRILVRPLNKQIKDLEIFVSEVKEERNVIPNIGVNTILKGEIFKTLDKGEFLDALEKVNKIKYQDAVNLANKTHGSTQILSYYTEMLQYKFEQYVSIVGKLTDELNENIFHLRKSFNQYGLEIEKSIKDDPINDDGYAQMGNLIYEHLLTPSEKGMNNIDIDIFKLEQVLFIPLLKILVIKRSDERTSNILEFTTNCARILNKLKSEKLIISRSIAQIQKELKLQANEIEVIISSIDKRK